METLESEFLKFCMISSKGYGMDNLSAKLFGILFLEPNEISLENLAKKTGYSLASVSNKMKILERMELVQRIKKPGSKKHFFYMEKDVYKLTKAMFEKVHTSEILPAKEMMPVIINKFKSKKLSKSDEEKLNIIIKYHRQILSIEKVFEEFLNKFNELK